MMKKRSSVMLVTIGMLGMILLSGCPAGTGGNDPVPEPLPPGTTVAASIRLLVSNEQLDSDVAGAPTVTLQASVLDSNLNLLSGKAVTFSADSGVLNITRGTTDSSGTATATLGAGGDPTNRLIKLTAQTGSVAPAANAVAVTGTNLSISGAASLSSGDSTPLTIFLKDSKGKGISGRTVTVTSAKGNTLSAVTYVTNASGQVICNVTAKVGGADKITASAIGATKDFDLMVNTTILRFITPPPAAVTEIPIGTNRSLTVEYISGTTPQAGVVVNFVTTRGFLSSSSATTGGDGRATVTVSSTNSGPASLVASVADGPTSQATVEFVAPTASKMDLQASPAVIGTNSGGLTTEKSLITATVRDVNDNLVKNKTVTFTIVTDASAGSLSPASAITDSFGSASTYFIAGASSGGLGGVTIRAAVVGTSVTKTTTLTVAKKSLFISLATGPTITKVDPNKYQKDYVALVTDSAGNPVAGATVVATVTPMNYRKGYFRAFYGPDGKFVIWVPVETLDPAFSTLPAIPACANEDGMLHNPLYDYNGILDPGEDQNGNNRLDPGNVASVTAAVTDGTGHGTVSIVYARDYAHWVTVNLEAFANDLKGSTASALVTFDLTGAGEDYANEKISPPGNPSPFGTSTSCYVDLMVTPISSSQMAISWQKSPTADHYHVYRNGINIASTTQTTYFDSGLSHGTLYCYQVTTVDAVGVESSFTGTVCNATAVLPPSGLSATAISPSQIRLSWSALSGATGYRVYRDTGFGLVHLKDVVSTSTVDSGLTPNTLYCYAVSGNSAAGVESPQSVQMCATTQLSAPSSPTGLTATGREVPSTVTLAWNASAGACKYNIYRNGGVTPAMSISAPAVTALDSGLDLQPPRLNPQTNYCYTISAENCSGSESEQSTQACTSTGGALIPSPTGLTATLLAGPQVRLNWSAAAGASGYRIYRNGNAMLLAGGTSVTDTGVLASTGYCYAVAALDGTGSESVKSAQVCIVTGEAAPPTPSGLFVEEAAGPKRVILRWNSSTGAVSYRIYRNGGTIPLLSPVGAPATDASVAASTLYCYTISAVGSTGSESAPSTVPVCITTTAPGPPTPTGLTAVSPSSAPLRVVLNWAAAEGAVSYRIYRNGTLLLSTTEVSANDTAVAALTLYSYTVSAINASGVESPQSPAVYVTTIAAGPPTPGGLQALQADNPRAPLRVNLIWNSSAGAVSYRIYRNGLLLQSPAAAPAIDTAVVLGTFYCYTISAVDLAGNESAQSANPQCVTILP